MRTKRLNRYYCDFCRKAGMSKFWIAKHEKGCTANPARVCGLCAHTEQEQKPIAELMACLSGSKEDCGMADLRAMCRNCPACILAAIRQSGLQKVEIDEDGVNSGLEFNFDFKKEIGDFWTRVNDAALEHADF